MESIITKDMTRCFLCGSTHSLQTHHCVHGFAGRKKADQDGLTVKLCNTCHRIVHDVGVHDRYLQRIAQKAWQREYGGTVEDFIQRYGKSYL